MRQLNQRTWEEPMKIGRLVLFVLAAAAALLPASAARAAMKTQWIDYKEGNTPLSGFLVYDDAVQGRRPGVLMIHDRSGFSEGTLADAAMIARLGYVVFAEDIFGKGIVPKSVPEMTEQITIYDKDRPLMRARALAGFDVLKAQPMVDPAKLASVGYCFGGTVGVELVETGVPLLGFISVHGAFRNFAPEAAKNIKGRVLILHGTEDPVAPLEEVNALISQLRAAKVNFEVDLYSGTAHAFTKPQNPSEVRADEEYKVAMTDFLKDLLAK
jgi:dienelactone hydrolase